MSPSYGGFLVTLFKIGNIYSHLAFTISSILFSFYPPKHSLHSAAAAAAASLKLCPTLCDPIGGSPLGSPVPGILQARTLEWVAISYQGQAGDSEGKCGPESSLRFSQEETGQQMGWASLNHLQGSGVEELPLVV